MGELRLLADHEGRGVKVNREFSPHTKAAIRDRAGDKCEVCREARIDHFHHRLMRSHGGMGTMENGLAVCYPCHSKVHLNPYVSYMRGWLVRSGIESDGAA